MTKNHKLKWKIDKKDSSINVWSGNHTYSRAEIKFNASRFGFRVFGCWMILSQKWDQDKFGADYRKLANDWFNQALNKKSPIEFVDMVDASNWSVDYSNIDMENNKLRPCILYRNDDGAEFKIWQTFNDDGFANKWWEYMQSLNDLESIIKGVTAPPDQWIIKNGVPSVQSDNKPQWEVIKDACSYGKSKVYFQFSLKGNENFNRCSLSWEWDQAVEEDIEKWFQLILEKGSITDVAEKMGNDDWTENKFDLTHGLDKSKVDAFYRHSNGYMSVNLTFDDKDQARAWETDMKNRNTLSEIVQGVLTAFDKD